MQTIHDRGVDGPAPMLNIDYLVCKLADGHLIEPTWFENGHAHPPLDFLDMLAEGQGEGEDTWKTIFSSMVVRSTIPQMDESFFPFAEQEDKQYSEFVLRTRAGLLEHRLLNPELYPNDLLDMLFEQRSGAIRANGNRTTPAVRRRLLLPLPSSLWIGLDSAIASRFQDIPPSARNPCPDVLDVSEYLKEQDFFVEARTPESCCYFLRAVIFRIDEMYTCAIRTPRGWWWF